MLEHNEIKLIPVILKFINDINNKNFIKDKSGVNIVELINASIRLSPKFPIINFEGIRKTPEKYAQKELEWYKSQDLSVNMIGQHASIWNNIASKDKKVNSNYGYLIWSSENYNQYENTIAELIYNPASRRAIMIYNRPSIWNDWNENGMNDFICTMSSHFFIRNNKLVNIVTMRSNDFIYGFFNDFYWHCYIYEQVFDRLKMTYENLEWDEIYWNVNSMHVYENHFEMILKIGKLINEWEISSRKERRDKNTRRQLTNIGVLK
ncbi:MAG TPA: thymidylate synthase [Thermotogota bacterium]|nr:thymidylate synthase [Thermotogota bacterium]